MPAKKFKSPQEMEKKIDKYFKECDATKEPYTVYGLALSLDTTYETLLDYQDDNEHFKTISETDKQLYSEIVKRAKAKVAKQAEINLYSPYVTGAIFKLKQFGWTDRQEIKQDVNLSGGVIILPPVNK